MISGICHYHYSNNEPSNTPEQSTRLAHARTSSGVLEHLHVFALTSSCCNSCYPKPSPFVCFQASSRAPRQAEEPSIGTAAVETTVSACVR